MKKDKSHSHDKAKNGHKSLSEKDKSLFLDAMQGITPRLQENIDPFAIQQQTRQEKEKIRQQSRLYPQNATETTTKYALSDHAMIAPVSHEEHLFFSRSGIQHAIIRKLKQGKYPINMYFDLHGLHIRHARQHLIQFLHTAQQQNQRCVLVIHGKGQHSTENHPILKNKVNNWLRQYPIVLAFYSALPKDGGNGALYVLLKKLRIDLSK